MTRAIPFTKASVRRAIAAAREAGLYVTGIRPDGTLILSEHPGPDDNPQGARKDVERKPEIVL